LLIVRRLVLTVGVMCACTLGVGASGAMAEEAHPGWEVFGRFGPTVLKPGSEGREILYVYNVGGASEAEGPTVVDALPAGLEATNLPSNCSGTTEVTCKSGVLEPGGYPEEIRIPVEVSSDASGEAVDRLTAAGGGALGPATNTVPVRFGSESTGLEFVNTDLWISNIDGRADTQAGSHPYDLTFAYSVDSKGLGNGGEYPTGGEQLDLDVRLPPGLVGDPNAVPRCRRREFDNAIGSGRAEETCPADTQVGVDAAGLQGLEFVDLPVYNLVPPPGVAAQFAFSIDGIDVFIDARVRSGGDYGITEQVDNLPKRHIVYNSTTIWGVPEEASHDLERYGTGCLEDGFGGCGSNASPAGFLTLPTSCAGARNGVAEIRGTWEDLDAKASQEFTTRDFEGNPVGFTGCERLVHFEPTVSIAPDTSFSDTPAGLTTTVRLPQGFNAEGLATSGLKETTVTLPKGIVINPGQATGLVACQPSEENIGGLEAEYESEDGPPSCPAASKVGTDEISTPLLANKLKGNVYVLQNNPPELQLLVAASGEGVNLKLIGTVHLNERTGQLTATFNGTPQDPGTPDAPLTEFVLSFSGGAQAALVTPPTCGVYSSTADFTPWASPFVESALLQSRFQITNGPDGSGVGACTGPLPFTPVMTAGATTDQAGGYTDFSMLLQRGDGQQRVSSLSFKTPEGLLGMIAKVPLCPEAQANAGTCSAASQIGHTVVGAGPGPYPLFIPQNGAPPAPIYLTGPYKGAPFGLSIVVPLIAGPFNLGTEVVRARIEVDPHTAQITVVTDPLPTIVKGIPADLRSINAVIDRPEFMFNPTDCSPMSFSGTATSTEGVVAPLSSHFQMGSCQSLKFQPNFKVSTAGKTSRANGASLIAKIVYPVGSLGFNQASSQSNINSVKVDLPKQLPSRLTTLQKACTAATFQANPANCPAASVVGHARVLTPVLPVPLEGPAYFVSHAGEEFPSLIVVLQGYGVTVELVGSTFINSKTNVTSSTFKQVPDVPIGLFELVLPQGKYSALAANGNLCKAKLLMPTSFIAQNGARLNQSTPIAVTGCTKHKAKARPKKKGNGAKRFNGRGGN
jgi:hypothetical protein